MTLQRTKFQRAVLIENPASRRGNTAVLDEGVSSLKRAGLSVEKVAAESVEQSREAILRCGKEVDLVIVAGGDGTVSSCAPALLERGLPFAILPLGTANDLARSLGITDLDQAFAAIQAGFTAAIDIGVVNGHHFFNVANLGLGVKVTEELTPELKQRWGVLSYCKALFSALARHRQFKVSINADGNNYSMRSIQLAVGNGRFYGGGNAVHASAKITDGLLHLYSLRPQGVRELLTLAPLLRIGRHDDVRRTFTVEGQQIRVETRPEGMAIHADGEPVTETPAEFMVKPSALTVVVPEQAGEGI
ncbi:lipid kinase [Microbulbifer sp. SA54]|uniref:lipid kinase n=1 Tax=Microbulbifer sp. SA54 TaxID=3401577 RepID=UPI003AAA421C